MYIVVSQSFSHLLKRSLAQDVWNSISFESDHSRLEKSVKKLIKYLKILKMFQKKSFKRVLQNLSGTTKQAIEDIDDLNTRLKKKMWQKIPISEAQKAEKMSSSHNP